MVNWIKSIVQVLLLTLVIQVLFTAEMSWGNIDEHLLGYILHVFCWILLTLFVFGLLETLRKNYRDASLEAKGYSYGKLFGLVILGIIIKILIFISCVVLWDWKTILMLRNYLKKSCFILTMAIRMFVSFGEDTNQYLGSSKSKRLPYLYQCSKGNH